MMEFIKKYKWYLVVAAVVLIGGAAALLLSRGNDAAAATAVGDGETAVAFTGSLAESATASGQVLAQREAVLSAAAPGIVEAVNVEVGDAVRAGDVLVQLERSALERAVASAEQGVTIAQAELDNLLDGAAAADIAAAEAALAGAQTALDDLIDGPSAADIAASEATVQAARANVWSAAGNLSATNEVSEADIAAARKALDDAIDAQTEVHQRWVDRADCRTNDAGEWECTPKKDDALMDSLTEEVQRANADVAIKQAQYDALLNPDANAVASSQAGVGSAQAAYEAALARHEALLAGATAADIAAAEADVASARASLEALVSGPKDTDRIIYETRLAQAQTALLEAQNALADAAITAPFDGVVTAVHVARGEQAAGPVVDLLETGSLEVILQVDEVDVGRLQAGQEAIITLETWPDVEIPGAITTIAPSAGSANGAVSYDVHLSLGETDLPVLVGMTANANLITANRENVLLVPNAAVATDRANNIYTVNVVTTAADGTQVTTPVQVGVGLKDGRYTQITDGLSEGDVVLLGRLEAPVFNPFGPGRMQ
jgi:HlyD family secretion protein